MDPLASPVTQDLRIIAVDWAKAAGKRAAYVADCSARAVSRLPFDGSLAQLVEHAADLDSPVLVGIDAAIGMPLACWAQLTDATGSGPGNFVDLLLDGRLPGGFFDPVSSPDDWSATRPFIRPPSGKWSRTAFEAVAQGGFLRAVDSLLQASPIFVTSGIPGSVGSGTRALWQELRAMGRSRPFSVWPFHGSLADQLVPGRPVIAEIYPKACYAIALAGTLPAPLRRLAKTDERVRRRVVDELLESDWVARERLDIRDVDAARANEDDFDALVSAVAITRLVVEYAPLENPESIETTAEGGVLGVASLTGLGQRRAPRRYANSQVADAGITRAPVVHACPIPGCLHRFHGSRGGWDAHVASLNRHPDWNPDVRDASERKRLFRQAFASWFER